MPERVEVIEGQTHTVEGSGICIAVTFESRTEGALHETHRWSSRAWIDDTQVGNAWCFSRETAIEEALGALVVNGVAVDFDDD